ncbi:MAG: response regulator, partial [SAR324 cluster bacterium]|nr:response regulator [SAR324 cluster bacterium]
RSGIELLGIMKKKYPATKRFLLTGKTSTEDAINAFNSGIIHRFINKPWDKLALGHEVQGAIETYLIEKVEQQVQVLKGKIIEKRTEQIKEIKKDLINTQTQLSFAQDQSSENQPIIPDEMLNLKYMIIEAKEEIAIEYTKALNHIGIKNTIHFTSGISALKHYEEEGADIILSEWDLDQLSGLDLLKLVRKKKNVLYQPIFIFATTLANLERVETAQTAKTDGFVIKPFTLHQLFELVVPMVIEDQHLTPRASTENLGCFSCLLVETSKAREMVIRRQLAEYELRDIEVASDTDKGYNSVLRRSFDIVIFNIHAKGALWNEFHDKIKGLKNGKNTALILSPFEPGIGALDDKGFLPEPLFRLPNIYSEGMLQEELISAINHHLDLVATEATEPEKEKEKPDPKDEVVE